MKIGVVSDTHGNLGSTAAAVDLLRQHDIAAVIHCGDIGSEDVVPLFEPWPTHFVFGNVDYDDDDLALVITGCGQTCHRRFGQLELGGRRIAWLHSDDRRRFEDTIRDGSWDLVCYGHTHVAEQHREGPTLVLNPGALHRANPRTIAVVDLETLHVTHLVVTEN